MIFVDPRVGSKHLATGIAAQALPFEMTYLEYGDCAFYGNGPDDTQVNIGIELKNINDLVNSMHSGRLAAHQIPGLVSRYTHVWLVVEGVYRVRQQDGLVEVPRVGGWHPLSLGARPVFWKELEGFLTTLEVQAGIHIRRTNHEAETARFIGLLYRWWTEKEFAEHRSLKVLDVPRPAGISLTTEDGVTTRLRRVAACLPCIGWGRSKAVAQRFKSIANLVAADATEWEEIDGIGKTIARDVVKAIREEIDSIPDAAVPARELPARRGAAARSARHSRGH